MLPILFTLAVTIVVSAAFQWLMTYCTNRVSYKTVRDLRIQTYEKINTLPLNTSMAMHNGDLISRIVNDVDQISMGCCKGITQLFTGIVTIVGTLLFMLTISPCHYCCGGVGDPALAVCRRVYCAVDSSAVRRTAGDTGGAVRFCRGDDRRPKDCKDLPL